MKRKVKNSKVNDETSEGISDQYKLAFKFLKDIKWFVVFSFGLFMFLFIFGFAYPYFFSDEILKYLKEVISSTEGMSTAQLVIFIFLNNLKASFFAFALGITFAVMPLALIVVNGYVLGFVSRLVASQEGITILWRLLPHGIFELPAIIFSVGIGTKIGFDLLNLKKGVRKTLLNNYAEGLRFFVLVVIPFLIIAAIIEGILIKII